jgi:hypothetical protein
MFSRAAILNCTSENYEAQSPKVLNNRRQSKVTNDISDVIRGSPSMRANCAAALGTNVRMSNLRENFKFIQIM